MKGGLSSKRAFQATLKAAAFKSVTGSFRFNATQFPIRNYYRVDVVRDVSGQPVFASRGVVLREHADAYYQYYKDCPLN